MKNLNKIVMVLLVTTGFVQSSDVSAPMTLKARIAAKKATIGGVGAVGIGGGTVAGPVGVGRVGGPVGVGTIGGPAGAGVVGTPANNVKPFKKTYGNGTGSSYKITQGSNNTYVVKSTSGSGRVWTNKTSFPVQLAYQLGDKKNPGKLGNSQLAAGASITMADQVYTIKISPIGANA